ncbi:MAG TPA: DUF2207 domain-containing protein [Rhizomicrobium sp.]|nr:DUF2207 domain-containing protein [Rhizomicrobium sp.]
MMLRRAVLLAAILASFAGPASAEERITGYNSNIDVARNGALTVTETVSVVAEGVRILHGIYRDFPTTYTDKFGRRVHVGFNVLRVTRDGHEELYDLSSIDSGERIKIGDPNNLVLNGPHTYTITYSTDRQIGFFADYDELYWNVTGNFWQFPIDRAEATINLPSGARITQYASYTGSAGSRANNAQCQKWSSRTLHCWTTAALSSNEGLTAAVGFAKGAVLPPTAAERRAEFIRDNASAVVAIAGVLILLIYFGTTWFEFGRDPEHGTIIPLFAPPRDFSPAAVRYVHRMAYDRKVFAAALIDMAVKGYMKIAQHSSTYTLTRTGKSGQVTGLDTGEEIIGSKLFSSSDDSVELKQTNHTSIAAAISGLKTTLKNEYERRYFVTNAHWFIGGLGILALTGIAAALLSDDPAPAAFLLAWLAAWSAGTSFLLHRAADAWGDVFAGPGSRILNAISAIFSTAFAAPFLFGLVLALYRFGSLMTWLASAALIVGGAAAYIFYHLLKAPTLLGSKIRDQIDGFRIYLNTAEKDRLEKLNPPSVTPAVFEKFLPYAIALDCENTWSKKFEQEAAAAGITASRSGYSPGWYSGSSLGGLDAAAFASSLGASMASAAAAASTAPGSSSGSGGGGSSGGGGGGGGGGGW